MLLSDFEVGVISSQFFNKMREEGGTERYSNFH
jgi:hypothetical protein